MGITQGLKRKKRRHQERRRLLRCKIGSTTYERRDNDQVNLLGPFSRNFARREKKRNTAKCQKNVSAQTLHNMKLRGGLICEGSEMFISFRLLPST